MNKSILEKYVSKERKGKNWTYVLEREDVFSEIGYKFAHSKFQEGFLKCTKIRYNGRTKLIYFPGNNISLNMVLCNKSLSQVKSTLYQVFLTISNMKKNAFLRCENFVVDTEQIYVDPETFKVNLIYIPIVQDDYEDMEQETEQLLIQNIISAIRASDNMMLLSGESILDILLNSKGDLEKILPKLMQSQAERGREIIAEKILTLKCKEEGIPLQFEIKETPFTIGRRGDNNGILNFSNKVSRLHCKIIKKGSKYYVIDEESKMGTFLNGEYCVPQREYCLENGDELAVAGIKFVVIEKGR